jgi:hypothetical protein
LETHLEDDDCNQSLDQLSLLPLTAPLPGVGHINTFKEEKVKGFQTEG